MKNFLKNYNQASKKTKKFFIFYWYKILKISRKKKIIIGLILFSLLVILFLGFIFRKKIFKEAPKNECEVAVVVRGQYNADPSEDLKNSLKEGDVLVIQPAGHNWSNTERVSYLILKMSLTDDEKNRLAQPQERKVNNDEINREEIKRLEEIKDEKAKDRMKNELENRKITLRAREYRINLEKYFPGFDPMILLDKGQPYLDKVYDWEIVEKKEKVK